MQIIAKTTAVFELPLTPEDVAKILGVNARQVYRWVRAGKISHIRYGEKASIRFMSDHVKDFIEAKTVLRTRRMADENKPNGGEL